MPRAQILPNNYKPGDPVSKFCSARLFRTLVNFLQNLRGMGIHVDLDLMNECRNPRIVNDGSSDEAWPPGFTPGGGGGGAAQVPAPFDFINGTAGDDFAIRGDGAEYMLWRLAAKIPTASIGASGLTYNATSGNWDGVFTTESTKYIYIEIDRAAESAPLATIYLAASIPSGTDDTGIRPLWRLTYTETAGISVLNLRDHYAIPGMA